MKGVLLSIVWLLTAIASADLIRKSTSRCENICADSEILNKDHLTDCERGCQYFNIEFLVSATDFTALVNIKAIEQKCNSSCQEAYTQEDTKMNCCFFGCHKMANTQKSAPYVNDWVVYMGASERGMVLMQSSLKVPSASDWILLESFLAEEDDSYKDITVTKSKDTAQHLLNVNTNFLVVHRLPIWMWFISIVLLFWVLWMMCNTIAIVSEQESENEISKKPLELPLHMQFSWKYEKPKHTTKDYDQDDVIYPIEYKT